jgi:hypothetical protein
MMQVFKIREEKRKEIPAVTHVDGTRGELQIVLAGFESESLPVNLVHAGQGLLPLKTRSFLEFAAPRLRERMRRTGSKTPKADA